VSRSRCLHNVQHLSNEGGTPMSTFGNHSQGLKGGQQDSKQYRRLMVIAVVLFFVAAAFARLLHIGARPVVAETGEHETLYQEARRMASTVLPYAFMN